MSKESKRREAIFNKFSRNLEWIQENPSFGFEPRVKDGYVCPLCLRVFEKQHLHTNLTFDHNPPRALGGKSGVLTCKDCNSKSGIQLDAHLLKVLMENDFRARLPHSKMRTKIESNGNQITADVEVDGNGKMSINLLKQYSNPKDYDKIMNGGSLVYVSQQPITCSKPLPPGFTEVSATVKNPENADVRRAEVTLLKIAYLRAFELFGYGFIIHPFLPVVQDQIINPNKIILPNILSIGSEIPRHMLGINFLRRPKELKCFFIVFEVRTNSNSRIFGVPLPGWNKPGLDIYFPEKHGLFGTKEMITHDCDFTHFSGMDYVAEKKAAFTAMDIWFNFENETSR